MHKKTNKKSKTKPRIDAQLKALRHLYAETDSTTQRNLLQSLIDKRLRSLREKAHGSDDSEE